MPFVKLDCGFRNSTLWFDKNARDVFLTALLMAEPYETTTEMPTYDVRTGAASSFVVPPGWYGFVPAASTAIVSWSMADTNAGMEALVRQSEPDPSSRTPDFEGRRMVRVNGGFIILNYQKYRDRDYTAADRSRRYRERKRHAVASSCHGVALRSDTQAEAEAEVKESKKENMKRKKFVPPTVDQVREEILVNGYRRITALKFWEFYEQKGWMVGRSRMKNWRVALSRAEREWTVDRMLDPAVARVKAENAIMKGEGPGYDTIPLPEADDETTR